jgi:hypothetical protein
MQYPKRKISLVERFATIGIIFILVSIIVLFSESQDWGKFDEAYGFPGDFHGKCISTRASIWFTSAQEGGHGGTGRYDICSGLDGFYFGTPIGIFGLKPILVPWHDVSMHVEDRPAYQTVVLKFRRLPGYTLEFAKDNWDQLSVPVAELSH